jgi:transcriptional regulator with XRE-family HTH domain
MLYEARYIALRQELVRARLRAGLTQLQVAQLLHKVQSFVSKVETGERYLDVIDFLAWCDATNASATELIGRVQSSSAHPP